MSIETAGVIVGAVAALVAIASIARTVWHARRRRSRVVLSIETAWKGPWLWTRENIHEGKPQIELLTVTNVVPNDGHRIVVEDCGLWIAGRDHQLDVSYGARAWRRIEPGEKHKWYAATVDIRRALGALGLCRALELRSIVRSATASS